MRFMIKVVFFIAFIFFILFGVLMATLIFYAPSENAIPSDAALITIFGAGYHKDGYPVPALEQRLLKGISLWERMPAKSESLLVISGRREEVSIMHNFLENKGIPSHRIVPDIHGTNTRATVLHTKSLLKGNNKYPVFISQAYHLPRIQLYTFIYGMPNAYFIAANRIPLPISEMLPLVFRESVAIFIFPFVYFLELI